MARQELVRKWSNSGFTLRLWDTYRTDQYGKSILAYEFKNGRKVIFQGEDFADYTPDQRAWMESRAEELSSIAMELEESARDR
jgi:hypothetical protein